MQENQLVVIFDFDGTMAETLTCAVEVLNRLSEELGFRRVKGEDVGKLRNEGKWEGLFKNLGIPSAKIPEPLVNPWG